MSRVDVYVHGHGRGHAHRARHVVARLRDDGHAVELYAGGEAADLLEGFHARSPILPGSRMPLELSRRIVADTRRMRGDPPDVVVSDGDQAAIGAGRARGVQTIAVGHGLVFAGCILPAGLPRRSLLYQRANTLLPTELARHRVAVHFLPAEPAHPGVTVARPDLPPELAGETSDEGFVLAYFSFGKGEPIVEVLQQAGATVRAYGAGAGVQSFDREGFRRDMLRCRAVVSSAGSNVIAECVALGKPILALHEASHHEQTLNAAMVGQAEVGLGATFATFDDVAAGRRLAGRFWGRARAGDFATISLLDRLAPVSEVVAELIG